MRRQQMKLIVAHQSNAAAVLRMQNLDNASQLHSVYGNMQPRSACDQHRCYHRSMSNGEAGREVEQKRRGPLFWVLTGIAVLVLLLVLVIGFVGYRGYQAAERAGITPEIMKSNPKFGAHKMMVAFDPKLEIIAEDADKDEITVREKASGNTFVHRMDPQGKAILRPTEAGALKDVDAK
jgi:hypothetical protein